MAHATNDINSVRSFLGPAVMYSADTLTRLIIVITIMLSLNISLTLFALIPLPLLSILVYKVGKLIHEKFTLIQEKFSELTTKAQENYSGIRVIKSYVREENEIKGFKKLSRDFLERNMDMIKIQALLFPLLLLITGLSVIIIVWLGGVKVINNEISLGDIVAFIAYLGMLTWPMIAFGWVINIIQQGEASMKRLNKIFAEQYEIKDTDETDFNIKDIKGEIEFKNVSFRYSDNLPYIIKNVNLKIPIGSTTAVMGYTGSGKTTFINLIPRLYDITEGEVLIDGANVKNLPLKTLRTNIGLVQQEAFLFSDTIMNNISYGLRDINKERVEAVSAIANFTDDVNDFPKGFDTMMGERGITLSGGQKQRASLARSLAIDPKILILDDSFSAVDTNTEEKILKNLKNFMRDKTSIIISHRISTVKDADNIIVLADGKIKEQGKHEDLVSLNGIYADLHYKQLLEKELEELN
jgi:ATP-binding cassette subfamily B protein